jgi:hypothetical protein
VQLDLERLPDEVGSLGGLEQHLDHRLVAPEEFEPDQVDRDGRVRDDGNRALAPLLLRHAFAEARVDDLEGALGVVTGDGRTDEQRDRGEDFLLLRSGGSPFGRFLRRTLGPRRRSRPGAVVRRRARVGLLGRREQDHRGCDADGHGSEHGDDDRSPPPAIREPPLSHACHLAS